MQQEARDAGGQPQCRPIAKGDGELLDENPARVNQGDLPQGKAPNHDRQRLHPRISPLRGDDRHQRGGNRNRLDRALKEADDAGAEAGRHEIQPQPGQPPPDRAPG